MNWFDQSRGSALVLIAAALGGCGSASLSTGSDAGAAEDLAQPPAPDLAHMARDLSPPICNVATNAGCGPGSRCVLRGASQTMFGCEPDVTGKTCDHCLTSGPNAIDGWDCNEDENVCGAFCRSDADCHADEFCSPYGVNPYQFGTCITLCNLLDPCGCPNNLRCTIGRGESYAHCQNSYGFCNNGTPTTTTPNVGVTCSNYWDCIADAVCLQIPPQTSAVCSAACDVTHPCTDPTKTCVPTDLGQSRIPYQFCL
jgi:hypothetical protein